ncbi:MAG TPA: glycosyltransferase [Gaiellaceae bacterium]|nr:glycosyltransferase [Gaiellaceae bacterium]
MTFRTKPRAAIVHARSAARRASSPVRNHAAWLVSRRSASDIALFHDYAPPPSGGGNQFLKALTGELERRGLLVESNRISGGTRTCLFNSFNFDIARLRRFARDDVRMVHRVDGPIGVYRGFDDGTDQRIRALNDEVADATVLQSRYSLEKHRELGIDLVAPVVVPNAVDPAIFYPPQGREPLDGRPARLIASSWSDNPRKGSNTIAWLDRSLDPRRFEMTFVGRTQVRLERIRAVGPVGSEDVADLLRRHDVYIAASYDDPCSNALLEALACGLPAVFRLSGGHPELVGKAGLPFTKDDELPDVLERLVAEIDARSAAIAIPSLAEVADRYLEVLRG